MSLVTYTIAGPFVNNSPPGWSASVINAIETFLAAGWFDSQITSDGAGGLLAVALSASGAVKPNVTPTTTNGNTNGTVKMWMPFQGQFKLVLLYFNAFRNAGANQDLVLPTAFTSGAFLALGNFVNPTGATSSGLNLLAGGSAISLNMYASAGSVNAGTNAKAMNIGFAPGAFDTIRILGTANWSGNATDPVVIIGS